MTGRRAVRLAVDGDGWVVTVNYCGGRWDGFETAYRCRWYWQARREFAREMKAAS